jgi:hypothetical protein
MRAVAATSAAALGAALIGEDGVRDVTTAVDHLRLDPKPARPTGRPTIEGSNPDDRICRSSQII